MRAGLNFRRSALLVLLLAARCTPATERAESVDASAPPPSSERAVPAPVPPHRVILFVWDGLRPDSITRENTPALADLEATGARFARHHAIYPTFTMVNAAGFATGAYPADHGYFGNTIYLTDGPVAPGDDSAGKPIHWTQPVFTEDGALLRLLDAHYRARGARGLLLVDTLFARAQAAGLRTAAVGKAGPVDLQDLARGGIVVDTRETWPLRVARAIQTSFALPPTAARAYEAGALAPGDGGNPLAETPRLYLDDGVTPDPEDDAGSPYRLGIEWFASVFIDYVLPVERPALSVFWLPNPDSTQHVYGPGTADARDALRSMDATLRRLEDKLDELHLAATTDLLVVSDHAHSTVSGPLDVFPLRAETGSPPRAVDLSRIAQDGFSVSGDVRLADLMRRARPSFEAYDGNECVRDPILSGITRDGGSVYASASCTTPGYVVPAPQGKLGHDAIVIANNGGTEYVYVPSHDEALIARVVRFLQSRPEVGAIFVARRAGGAVALPGTIPLSAVGLQDAADRSPDLVATYAWNDRAVVSGMPGTEFASSRGPLRGMHGSFSPIDVHNVLVARGPSFRRGFVDDEPSGNVDVAPTIAHLLGLELPQARGRCLAEALVDGCGHLAVTEADAGVIMPDAPAMALDIASATNPSGAPPAARGQQYTSHVVVERLVQGGKTYVYYDEASAERGHP